MGLLAVAGLGGSSSSISSCERLYDGLVVMTGRDAVAGFHSDW